MKLQNPVGPNIGSHSRTPESRDPIIFITQIEAILTYAQHNKVDWRVYRAATRLFDAFKKHGTCTLHQAQKAGLEFEYHTLARHFGKGDGFEVYGAGTLEQHYQVGVGYNLNPSFSTFLMLSQGFDAPYNANDLDVGVGLKISRNRFSMPLLPAMPNVTAVSGTMLSVHHHAGPTLSRVHTLETPLGNDAQARRLRVGYISSIHLYRWQQIETTLGLYLSYVFDEPAEYVPRSKNHRSQSYLNFLASDEHEYGLQLGFITPQGQEWFVRYKDTQPHLALTELENGRTQLPDQNTRLALGFGSKAVRPVYGRLSLIGFLGAVGEAGWNPNIHEVRLGIYMGGGLNLELIKDQWDLRITSNSDYMLNYDVDQKKIGIDTVSDINLGFSIWF